MKIYGKKWETLEVLQILKVKQGHTEQDGRIGGPPCIFSHSNIIWQSSVDKILSVGFGIQVEFSKCQQRPRPRKDIWKRQVYIHKANHLQSWLQTQFSFKLDYRHPWPWLCHYYHLPRVPERVITVCPTGQLEGLGPAKDFKVALKPSSSSSQPWSRRQS